MHLIVIKTNNGTKNRLHAKSDLLLLYYFDVGFSLYRSILMSFWVLISDVNYKPTAKPQRSEYQRKLAKPFINLIVLLLLLFFFWKQFLNTFTS